jgi:hypothetical protein
MDAVLPPEPPVAVVDPAPAEKLEPGAALASPPSASLPPLTPLPPSPIEKVEPAAARAPSPLPVSSFDRLVADADRLLAEPDGYMPRALRRQLDLISREISRRRVNLSELAAKLAIEKLEKELEAPIEREIKMEAGGSRLYFDGIIRRGSSLTAIEVRYVGGRGLQSLSNSVVNGVRVGLIRLYESLTAAQQKDFSFILAIVSENGRDRAIESYQKWFEGLPFPAAVKCYDLDELVLEQAK